MRTKVTCQYCKHIDFCLEPGSFSPYYVVPSKSYMTRLFIHQGKHSHTMEPGASIERLKQLVSTFLKFNRGSGPQKLQMLIARKLLIESITSKQSKKVSDRDLNTFLEELIPLIENQR